MISPWTTYELGPGHHYDYLFSKPTLKLPQVLEMEERVNQLKEELAIKKAEARRYT